VPNASEEKYSRQVLFAGLGPEGQQRLRASAAVVIGCGALGSASANALARAGVGRLTVVDRDYVELSNLQRQMLFDERDAAEALPKAVAAERHLRRINSDVQVECRIADVTPGNIEELISGATVVLDGTDNFETRYLLNDAAVKLGVPWVYGAAVGSRGVTMPIVPGRTPCLACVFPELPSGPTETCDTLGILNSATAAIAAIQAADALKIMAGAFDRLESRLLTIDVWENRVQVVRLGERRPECEVCGQRQFRYLAGQRRPQITMCGRNSVQIHEHDRPLDLRALAARLGAIGPVQANEFVLRFSIAPYEMTLFTNGRAIIKGTTDPAIARSLYARYIGN
jgi:molybdopterin/thiamine biosynthesis adenylyltransferase